MAMTRYRFHMLEPYGARWHLASVRCDLCDAEDAEPPSGYVTISSVDADSGTVTVSTDPPDE